LQNWIGDLSIVTKIMGVYIYIVLGIPTPPCADRWYTDSCSKEAKHIGTQYLTWFGKTVYIYGKESILFRDRERITTQYMEEEEDHFTQTLLPALLLQWQQGCCHCSPSLSLYTLHILTTLSHFSLSSMPIYRQVWWLH
jgi:hypothetical protein